MRASRVNPTRQATRLYFFRFGRCVRAEAAADFAALLDFGLRSTLAAAEAAFALVTSLFDFAISITSLLLSALALAIVGFAMLAMSA